MTDIITFIDEGLNYIWNIQDYTENIKNNLSSLSSIIDKKLTDINNNFSTFLSNFNDYVNVIKSNLSTIISSLQNSEHFLNQLRDYIKDLRDLYYPDPQTAGDREFKFDIKVGWHNFWKTFRYKKFDEILIDVHQQIEDTVNPLSTNNTEAFNTSINNIKENTFIGSANEMVTTFPEQLKSALTKDSSPVLQFSTVGVKNKYFSLPAKTYSIDFSWWAPFKGTADTLISAFMYLGFLIIFFKRLPEIIHGAGIAHDNYIDFQEARDFNYNEDLNDPRESYYFYNNGQWREGD